MKSSVRQKLLAGVCSALVITSAAIAQEPAKLTSETAQSLLDTSPLAPASEAPAAAPAVATPKNRSSSKGGGDFYSLIGLRERDINDAGAGSKLHQSKAAPRPAPTAAPAAEASSSPPLVPAAVTTEPAAAAAPAPAAAEEAPRPAKVRMRSQAPRLQEPRRLERSSPPPVEQPPLERTEAQRVRGDAPRPLLERLRKPRP